jgi:hypothetical protein
LFIFYDTLQQFLLFWRLCNFNKSGTSVRIFKKKLMSW